ncbi:hypothetical protein [Nocardia sp. NPDC051750]|uniref:hypothetical protein n=1 Tax=Nocardia sp. NPDC051750 TaxID=3364325 RepID=UPI003790797A
MATAPGTVVLPADASHFYGNVCGDAPFAVHTDLPGTYHAFDIIHELASSPELIVPGQRPGSIPPIRAGRCVGSTAVRIA